MKRNLLLALLLSVLTSRGGICQDHPNLLFILPDQWRGSAVGFAGEENVITPNLDRLARQSLVLTHAVSNYPVCSPYRGMLMTGQYPHTNGVIGNCNSNTTPFGYELRQSSRCWSDILSDQDYDLAYIGKWHLESPRKPFVKSYNNNAKFAWNEWTPPARRHGFGFWHAYNTFDQHNRPEYWTTGMTRDERLKVKTWGPQHETDQAIRWLQNAEGGTRDPAKPFAMVVAMNPPHMPYKQVPARYVEMYSDRSNDELIKDRPNTLPADTRWGKYTRQQLRYYYAMITGVDDQIGRLLGTLDELKLAENTIVVINSDHGNCLGIHGLVSKNNHYEEAVRVPLLVRWPGKIKPRHDNLLISVPDLYPTLMELMGFAGDIPDEVEGTSHAALFRTGRGTRPTSQLYIFTPPGKPAEGRRGVRTLRHTLMIEKKKNGTERVMLHDNVEDPFQLENIAQARPEIVKQLVRDELNPWLKKTGDPWKKND